MKRIVFIVLTLALVAFVAGVALVRNPFNLPQRHKVAPPPPPKNQVLRDVVVYFGTVDSPYLVQETRAVRECERDEDGITLLVRELVAGSRHGNVPVLPPQTQLLGVLIEGNTARLDFNRALIDYHPGGCSSELLTVRALCDTLAANYPYIRELIIAVEGKAVATLRGHVDLRRPVMADFSWVQRDSEVQTLDDASPQNGEQIH